MAGGASEARRAELLGTLRRSAEPVTGAELSSLLGVSRQAIVNDVAILRAAGEPIVGSPQGYLLAVRDPGNGEPDAIIACKHGREGARRELEILVDHGITVVDVVVEHALYGDVRANLMISSRADVDRYAGRLQSQDAPPLSSLTGGVHLHNLRAPTPDALEAAERTLRSEGFLLED
jgi:hypothetical protein